MKKPFQIQLETCAFIPLSALPISEPGKDKIEQTSNITFGDANRTMVTIPRLIQDVDFCKRDVGILNRIITQLANPIYVDLEN